MEITHRDIQILQKDTKYYATHPQRRLLKILIQAKNFKSLTEWRG